jgi:hypothetical protein
MFDQVPASDHVADDDGGTANTENPDIQKIRDALGAIAVAEPAVYWLYSGADGNWHLRREGELDERCYSSREMALRALQLAVIRCASYCLFLEGLDGRFIKEMYNWLLPQIRPDGRQG